MAVSYAIAALTLPFTAIARLKSLVVTAPRQSLLFLKALVLVQDNGLQTQLLEAYDAPASLYYDAEVMKLD